MTRSVCVVSGLFPGSSLLAAQQTVILLADTTFILYGAYRISHHPHRLKTTATPSISHSQSIHPLINGANHHQLRSQEAAGFAAGKVQAQICRRRRRRTRFSFSTTSHVLPSTCNRSSITQEHERRRTPGRVLYGVCTDSCSVIVLSHNHH